MAGNWPQRQAIAGKRRFAGELLSRLRCRSLRTETGALSPSNLRGAQCQEREHLARNGRPARLGNLLLTSLTTDFQDNEPRLSGELAAWATSGKMPVAAGTAALPAPTGKFPERENPGPQRPVLGYILAEILPFTGGIMRAFLGMFLILVLLPVTACGQSPSAAASALSGEKAMEHVRAQVSLGPRPPGSEALGKCREYLLGQLNAFGYVVEKDAFEAATPYGPKTMINLIARKPSNSGKTVVALASHYDTKYYRDMRFVGANDGGSSTGLLLELARVLAGKRDGFDYWFVFLDGEEAFIDWSTFDSTYGSRHLASRWKQDGTVPKIKALLLLDMIGEKNLGLQKDDNSTPWLMNLVWETAETAGFRDILSGVATRIEDDHIPLMDAGIPCADIIDLDYHPWHTAEDTLDKISASSMEKVGNLVLAVMPRLERHLSAK
jgi:hypothetical protein